MLATSRVDIVENSYKLSRRSRRRIGDIPSKVMKELAPFVIPVYHPTGTVLFAEGQPSRGAFILSSGRVKLFTSSADGKTSILKFADPGEMLGLAGTLSGQPYEAWAQAIQPAQTGFIERRDLVYAMRHSGEVAVQVAMQLGTSYCSAIAEVRAMALSRSASQKLAMFLLAWNDSNHPFDGAAVARLTLTHEEIAQVIGTTRETVTRIMTEFKKKGLIRWQGCNLALTDRAALETSAAN